MFSSNKFYWYFHLFSFASRLIKGRAHALLASSVFIYSYDIYVNCKIEPQPHLHDDAGNEVKTAQLQQQPEQKDGYYNDERMTFTFHVAFHVP